MARNHSRQTGSVVPNPNVHPNTMFYCVIDGSSYDTRDMAEAHVRMQHGLLDYDSYLASKTFF